jgi:hypothetical protein
MKLDDYDKEPNYYAIGYSIHYDQRPKSFIFESTVPDRTNNGITVNQLIDLLQSIAPSFRDKVIIPNVNAIKWIENGDKNTLKFTMNNQSIHDAIDMEELHPSLPMNNAIDNEHTEEQYSGDEPATQENKISTQNLVDPTAEPVFIVNDDASITVDKKTFYDLINNAIARNLIGMRNMNDDYFIWEIVVVFADKQYIINAHQKEINNSFDYEVNGYTIFPAEYPREPNL